MPLPKVNRKEGLAARLSLSQKGLILLALPAVVQLGLVAQLSVIHSQAEADADKAIRAREVSEATNQMIKSAYDTVKAGFIMVDRSQGDPIQPIDLDEINRSFVHLKELVKDSPADLKTVDTTILAVHNITHLMDVAARARQAGHLQDGSQAKKEMLRELRRYGHDMEGLVNLEQENKAFFNASPERQARMRAQAKTIVIAGTVINLLFLLALGAFFSRHIVAGLRRMVDNSFRLASEKPLNPPLPGSDEIAQLDSAFHDMADALTEASRKQKALIENARDVICSLDGSGAFVAASSAAATVFGYPPQELVGRKLIDLVDREYTEATDKELKLIMEGGARPPFETRLRRKDGSLVDILWSGIWSEIEGTMFVVAHDITERVAAERLRQEVVQMVSHDLRTPLSTLRSFHDMLETGMLGGLNEKGQQLLTVAGRNTVHMLSLINDLLDVEKMEAGMLQLDRGQIPMMSVFQMAVQTVSTQANDKGVKLEVVPTDVSVYADQYRLSQVLINLLSNAIKFSTQGGLVKISAQAHADFAEVRVADQGRGIPAHLINSVFERFQQVQQSDAKEKGGSGLGLAICKALVELHGGEIGVESELGKGATFFFRIPSEREEPSAGEPVQAAVAKTGSVANQITGQVDGQVADQSEESQAGAQSLPISVKERQ
jgi:PAS domain S-box-containing protein